MDPKGEIQQKQWSPNRYDFCLLSLSGSQMPSASVQVYGNTNEVGGQQCDGMWRMVAPFPFLFSFLGQTRNEDRCGARGWEGCSLACICVARKRHNRTLAYVIPGIRQAAEPLHDRVGVPDLGKATAKDCENQELLALGPGACQISAGSPQGQRPQQDSHRRSH